MRIVAGVLLCAPLWVYLLDRLGLMPVDGLTASVVLGLAGVGLLAAVVGGSTGRRALAAAAGLAWCALQILLVVFVVARGQL